MILIFWEKITDLPILWSAVVISPPELRVSILHGGAENHIKKPFLIEGHFMGSRGRPHRPRPQFEAFKLPDETLAR